MIDYDKLKNRIKFSMDISKTIGGEKAEGAIFAYENVLNWCDQLKSEGGVIDYEKLKLTHELADKYCKENNMTLVIEANCYAGGCVNLGHSLYFGTNEIENLERCSLDKIIAKLQELTQPKPKMRMVHEFFI